MSLRENENDLRDFDYAQDLPAVKRIWREVGWIDDDDEEALVGPMELPEGWGDGKF